MPPANRTSQTRDLTTSLPHAVVPSWLVSRDGVLQMQGGGFAYDPGWQPRQKQTRSSSYHLGTAFAWPFGFFGPDRDLPCRSISVLPITVTNNFVEHHFHNGHITVETFCMYGTLSRCYDSNRASQKKAVCRDLEMLSARALS